MLDAVKEMDFIIEAVHEIWKQSKMFFKDSRVSVLRKPSLAQITHLSQSPILLLR